MKTLIIILISLAPMNLGFAKANDTEDRLESTVQILLAGGAWEGQRDKQLIRAGDRVSVIIARNLGDRNAEGPSQLQVGLILDMIHTSFSNVSQVAVVAENKPHVALFILKYLDLIARDSATKARIATTKKAILSAADPNSN